jgi:hypothetical protein
VTIDVSNAAPQILLVSALFLSTSSNDSPSDYLSWLSQFLRPITTDVYFFTTPDLEPLVRRVRGNFPITINTSFSSSFDIPPLKGLQEKYNAMHTLDREKYQISPEGYAIRNAKMYFLDEAVRYSDKKYTFAFWTDADNFRANHAYAEWPDPARIAGVWEEGHLVSSMEKEDLLFFPIRGVPHSSFQFWDEGMGPVDNEVSEGELSLHIVNAI